MSEIPKGERLPSVSTFEGEELSVEDVYNLVGQFERPYLDDPITAAWQEPEAETLYQKYQHEFTDASIASLYGTLFRYLYIFKSDQERERFGFLRIAACLDAMQKRLGALE